MKWLVFAMLTLLAGCSGTRALQASKTVPYATLEQTVQMGSSTREQVRAALGESTSIRFDSGNEVWMYTYPAASGANRCAPRWARARPSASTAAMKCGCTTTRPPRARRANM